MGYWGSKRASACPLCILLADGLARYWKACSHIGVRCLRQRKWRLPAHKSPAGFSGLHEVRYHRSMSLEFGLSVVVFLPVTK